MCVVSMVHDHFNPLFPSISPVPAPVPAGTPWPLAGLIPGVLISHEEAQRIRGVIADFRAAVEAARLVDKLTAQPDCVDPEKAKLEERVAALEKRLAELEGSR